MQGHYVPPFSRANSVQALLDVEVALAEALADAGVIPFSSVAPIRAAARAELFDFNALEAEAVAAGNLAIPLARHLTREVAKADPTAAGHVHWGATSQDVIDTALVLQLRSAGALIGGALDGAARAAATLARRYAATPIAGRTWLQQASPTTFGAKAAVWLDGIERVRQRLASAGEAAQALQFGGATGNLAAFGAAAHAVAEGLAARLGLGVPEIPWHSERSRVADVGCALGLACGALGKVGRDLALLAQTEVGEVAEAPAPGRGRSSSMPHKQNPVAAVRAVAASVQAPGLVATMLAAMPQEHERAIGGWQAEWRALPMLAELTLEAARAIAEALSGLVVDASRMRANLDAAGGAGRAEGLVIALAPRIGRSQAMRVVEDACRRALAERQTLAEVAASTPAIATELDGAAIGEALRPEALTGLAPVFIEQVLARWGRGSEE
jgi:3-carboxy-cis,cis-muconate cycloisomerase